MNTVIIWILLVYTNDGNLQALEGKYKSFAQCESARAKIPSGRYFDSRCEQTKT